MLYAPPRMLYVVVLLMLVVISYVHVCKCCMYVGDLYTIKSINILFYVLFLFYLFLLIQPW